MDPTTDALRADLRQVGTLLRGYELIERADLVERLSEEDDDRLLLVASGPELWGGSGAVWEAEPFVHSHPDVASADTDYLEFQRAVVRISDRLDAGRLADLHDAIALAQIDWRDVLMNAGLANEDWPTRLDDHLGPTTT